MKDTWKILKLGVYIFALPLVATAAASAHQWMISSTTLAMVPAPAVVTNSSVTTINALRNHTITINEDGEVQGRVASINHKSKAAKGISDAAVYFIQDGKIVQKDYANEDGTFAVSGLKEGVYSFVAAGQFSFATCGVNVMKSEGIEKYLEVAAITPNIEEVRDLITADLPVAIRKEISRTVDLENVANVQGSNRVELEGDVLRGQIVSLFDEKLTGKTTAHLFRSNEKVDEFEISKDGTFEVANVKPGVHDIVVVGADGMAAVSFEAVAGIDEEVTDAYTSIQETLFSNFVVALAPQCDCGVASGCCGGGSDAIIYGDSPSGFLGNRLGRGIASGGCCGGAGNFAGFGGGALGGVGGRFGSLFGGGVGGRRLLLPLLAAGIAIPIAVGSSSPSAAN